jgi:putative selenate reductase
MSDRLRPASFACLLHQCLREYRRRGRIFGVPADDVGSRGIAVNIHDRILSSPVGVAAGPHTQIAQAVIAGYVSGARYFELKTIQAKSPRAQKAPKPCIYQDDAAFNIEGTSEFTVQEAIGEYVKAWFIIKILAKEFDFGEKDDLIFNMSAGYDLAGIKSANVNYFMDAMKNAKDTEIFRDCRAYLLSALHLFEKVDAAYIEKIEPEICDTITLSTLHGTRPDDIEQIVLYLLEQKRLHVYLKCNASLLGYERVKHILSLTGYGELGFRKSDFSEELSMDQAVPLIKRLKSAADQAGRRFGVKLTNTFPVDTYEDVLPAARMYMSGKGLYPLSINVAAELNAFFDEGDGALTISYSGGADEANIADIVNAGIAPVTVSTVLLKPGGYLNITRMNQALERAMVFPAQGINGPALKRLAENAPYDERYHRKLPGKKRAKARSTAPPKAHDMFCSKCGICADVCPHRANVALQANQSRIIVHMDAFCYECGNCACVCPDGSVPYRDKFTVYACEADFRDSTNPGVFIRDGDHVLRRDVGTDLPEHLPDVRYGYGADDD